VIDTGSARGSEGVKFESLCCEPLACTRFRRHRVRCFDAAGGGSWRVGSSRGNSSLRPCA
jgi:hypothetical protein